jgi:hypothetical protein
VQYATSISRRVLSSVVGKRAILFALAVVLGLPQLALAYSFAGSDWLVNLTGHLNAPINSLSQDIDQGDIATTIGQTSLSNIDIPLNIAELSLNLDVPGTVSGTHITANTVQQGPISLTVSGYNLRLYNITAHLEGEATSINTFDTSGSFGPRAYGITGYPTGGSGGTSYVNVGDVRVKTFIGYVSVGSATVDIYSWNAGRDMGAVPEPGTSAMLLGAAIAAAGFGWRKRRGR